MNKRDILLLLVTLAVASFFRLYRLDSLPPGLYHDEAINGNDALQALETRHLQTFYPENNGREGLLINLEALSFGLFGAGIWSLRIVSAISGILTIAGLFLLTRELIDWRVAAVGSYFLAILFWHVNFSRIAFSGVLASLCAVYALWLWWSGWHRPSQIRLICAGGVLGLGFYTYAAFRVMPLVVLITFLSLRQEAEGQKDGGLIQKPRFTGALAACLAAIVILIPLGMYFFAHPGETSARMNQLSVLNASSPVKAIAFNTFHMLAMFNWRGDANWRHNIADAPMLVWPIGLLFLIGLARSVVILARSKAARSQRVLLISWFFLGLLPAILTLEGIPHALRSLIVAPVACIFAAEGLIWLCDLLTPVLSRSESTGSGKILAVLVVILLATLGLMEYDRYFIRWAKDPGVADAFEHSYVTIGNGLNRLPREQIKYVVVNARGIPVQGIPMPAQTVMFITDTATPEKQKAKNIYYLTVDEYVRKQFNPNSVLVRLDAPRPH